jgi:hypothetical protein
MGAVVDAFNKLARDMVACETMLAGWLPCRAAIEVVCGMDWSRLGHGTKTRVGSWLRDRVCRSLRVRADSGAPAAEDQWQGVAHDRGLPDRMACREP